MMHYGGLGDAVCIGYNIRRVIESGVQSSDLVLPTNRIEGKDGGVGILEWMLALQYMHSKRVYGVHECTQT